MRQIIWMVCALLVGYVTPLQANHHGHHPAQPAMQSTLKPVATSRVCMVNNRVFKEDQIPIQIQGKTYYGCCAMCKDKLSNDINARQAIDPITGKSVDKATAIIAADTHGQVFYFENKQHLQQFNQKR